MTGNRIRWLRTCLGLQPTAFASMLGVSDSTLYRWEQQRASEAKIDPMQRNLLAVIEREVDQRTKKARAEFGEALGKAILLSGGLAALFILLKAVFGEGGPGVPKG